MKKFPQEGSFFYFFVKVIIRNGNDPHIETAGFRCGKEVTMNIGKNIDQQILNGKRKTVHLGKDECAMVGFGKKLEQGGFGQIISGRMKNGKRIMVAARKIVDRTCECPALCTAFSLDQNRKIKKCKMSGLRHQILDGICVGQGKGKGTGGSEKSAFFRFFVFRYRHFHGSALGKKRKKNRFCIWKNHRENA